VLVYNRISWNRRYAFLLPLAALLLCTPLPFALSAVLSMWMTPAGGPDPVSAGILFAASAVMMAAPCLVLWGLFSSQTTKLLGIYGAQPAGEAEQRLLENLSIGAGLPKPRLFVIETGAPNAFAIGVPGRAIIGLTRGLLDLMDHRELEGVLAHELSHIGNRDTQLNSVVASLVLFLRLPGLLWQRHISIEEQTRLRPNLSGPHNLCGRILFVALVPIWIYVFLIAPLMAVLLRAAISREREFLADADAALLTRYPEGLIRALAKIEGAGSAVAASPAVAHFYFADAVAPDSEALGTHPSVRQRIVRLVDIHGELAPEIVQRAIEDGKRFARERTASPGPDGPVVQDELSVLNLGNVMGRVYRAVSPGCVYDKPDAHSAVLAQITSGSLVVVFDDPGAFRQVLTTRGVFGYMPVAVKIETTDLLPAEVVRTAG
jgi:heat shock protein HtpX